MTWSESSPLIAAIAREQAEAVLREHGLLPKPPEPIGAMELRYDDGRVERVELRQARD